MTEVQSAELHRPERGVPQLAFKIACVALTAEAIFVGTQYALAVDEADQVSAFSNNRVVSTSLLVNSTHEGPWAYAFSKTTGTTDNLRFDFLGAKVDEISTSPQVSVHDEVTRLSRTVTRTAWPFTFHVTRSKTLPSSATDVSLTTVRSTEISSVTLHGAQCGTTDSTGFVEKQDTLFASEADFVFNGKPEKVHNLAIPNACTKTDNTSVELDNGHVTILGVQYPALP